MKKSLFLGIFFCLSFAQTAFAQVTVQLSEGKTFVIKGKEIYEDGFYGKCYLDETPDTIHYYTCRAIESGGYTLTHTRIPTRYFSKAESKISGANVNMVQSNSPGVGGAVVFRCNKAGSNASLKNYSKNEFLRTTYLTKFTEEKLCYSGINFKDKAEAKAFLERMKALSKK
jgi:hypothetical protein